MDEDRKIAEQNGSRRAAIDVPAAVIGANRDANPSYGMYQATEISEDGAFLRGPMLLEPNERFTLELAFEDGTRVRADALVERVDLGPVPGLDVRFTDLSQPARAYLRGRMRA